MKFSGNTILSDHLGIVFTWFITLLVVAITISALTTGGGITRRDTVRICYVERGDGPLPTAVESFRTALAGAVRRPVLVSRCEELPENGIDIAVVPVIEWLVLASRSRFIPRYTLRPVNQRPGDALLIARRGERPVPVGEAAAAEMLFADSVSIAGFWIQLSLLEEMGTALPASIDSFHFAGGGERACERAVMGVLTGRFPYAASCAGAVAALARAGVIDSTAVEVVARVAAIPDLLIVTRHGDAAWHREYSEMIRRSAVEPGEQMAKPIPAVVVETVSKEMQHRLDSMAKLTGRYRGHR